MKRIITFSKSIHETLLELMKRDKKIFLIGMGVNDPKGTFGTTKDLDKIFGKDRAIESPTSENAVAGICLGAAIHGMKPIISHQRVEFSLLSMEQIINQAAKWNFMTANQVKINMVFRLIIGKGWGQGPQHSQSLEALFAHIPGLKVVSPSTPSDAKGLLVSSLKAKTPVIFFEHRWLHEIKGEVKKGLQSIKIGKAKVIRKGKDLTLISYSEGMLKLRRILPLLDKSKISAEIIDLRSLRPIDNKTILKSVKKTKRLIVLDNGWKTIGISSEIIALISENIEKKLKANPVRLALSDNPIPSTNSLAKFSYINFETLLDTISKVTKKKINTKIKNQFFKKINSMETDIPFKDFRGPF